MRGLYLIIMQYHSIQEFVDHINTYFPEEKLQSTSPLTCLSIEKSFLCVNHSETIKTFCVEFTYNRCKENAKKKFEMHIDYNIIKCSYDKDETHSFYDMENVEECVHQLFRFLWEYDLCMECLYMIPKDQKLCGGCCASKLMWEWGLQNGKASTVEKCAICLEDVYSSKLSCGHRFHKTCFINLNTKEWFDEDVEIRCPICRKEISDRDKLSYFQFDY